jgi:hypothetical protein
MPQVNLAEMKMIIDDVARRSYRIREWEDLEVHLHNVEKSFEPFLMMLQLVETPSDFAKQAPILVACWTPCQDVDILELDSFALHFEHIHQPIMSDDTNYPALQERIASLITIGTNIQYALTHGVLDDLKKQAEAFNVTLHGQLANLRIMEQHEIEQLCEVTYRVRRQLR